ncbi:hypothetical protein [Bradyrhizobium liaoningense]|uniref:hypothetical protein n=1 Tax=Bradyrhizobium liaoningense TaxID=43992 RepID=UPI001BAB8FE6|nr:hypothetical protein [Bradyrhizobium liaoningense]MBR0822407.1 hypothetical protein [Bradyrhizobium liaoningense]
MLYLAHPNRVAYQFVVDQKKAALAEAEQGVKQLKASLDQASAGLEKANAQLALAQANYDRQNQLFQAKDIAQAVLDTAQRNLDAANRPSPRLRPSCNVQVWPTPPKLARPTRR